MKNYQASNFNNKNKGLNGSPFLLSKVVKNIVLSFVLIILSSLGIVGGLALSFNSSSDLKIDNVKASGSYTNVPGFSNLSWQQNGSYSNNFTNTSGSTFVSNCKGVSNGYSFMQLHWTNSSGKARLRVNYVLRSEFNYDYGILYKAKTTEYTTSDIPNTNNSEASYTSSIAKSTRTTSSEDSVSGTYDYIVPSNGVYYILIMYDIRLSLM